MLTSRALKVTMVLDPTEVAGLPDPTTARTVLRIQVGNNIRLPDRIVSADVAAKALRKVKATIEQHGPSEVAVIVQGKLVGDSILEAGLVAQVKVPKAAAPVVNPDR
jgi:hypothetical protein